MLGMKILKKSRVIFEGWGGCPNILCYWLFYLFLFGLIIDI